MAVAGGGGGALAAVSGGEKVNKLHGAMGKVAAGLAWLGEGRRRGLHGKLGGGGGHGVRRCSGVQGQARFGSGTGREWRGRSGTCAARAKEKERGEGAGRPALHVVAVAPRAAILGVHAGRRCRVARPRNVWEKPGAGKAVLAGGSVHGQPAIDAGARRCHGKNKEERGEVRAFS